MSDPELRHEIEATVHARNELGADLEPQLVDRLADRIEAEIRRRSGDGRPAQRQRRGSITPMVLGSLGIGIAATSVANSVAVAIVAWIAIALVNYFWATRS